MIERGLRVSIDARPAEAGASTYVKSVREMREEAQRTQAGMKGLDAAANDNGSSLASLAASARVAALGLVATGVAVGALLRPIVEVASQFQQLRAQLETVYGSASKAEGVFKIIQDFAEKTPFSVQNLTQAWINLRLTGFEPTVKVMASLSDVAGAMHKDITEVIDAARGAALGETERLKAFGVSAKTEGSKLTLSIGDMSRTVNRDIASVIGFLEELGDTKFAGGSARQAETFSGAVNNMQDALNRLADEIGRGGLLDALNVIIRVTTDWISENKELASVIGDALGTSLRDLAIIGVRAVSGVTSTFHVLNGVIYDSSAAILEFGNIFNFGPAKAEVEKVIAKFRSLAFEEAAATVSIVAGANQTIAALRAEAATHGEAFDDMNGQLLAYQQHQREVADQRAKAAKDAVEELRKTRDGYEQLRGSLDPAYKAQLDLARSQEVLNKAFRAGIVDLMEYLRLQDQLSGGNLPNPSGYGSNVIPGTEPTPLPAEVTPEQRKKAIESQQVVYSEIEQLTEDQLNQMRGDWQAYHEDVQGFALQAGQNLSDALTAGLQGDWMQALQAMLAAWQNILHAMEASARASKIGDALASQTQGGGGGVGGSAAGAAGGNGYGQTASQVAMVAGWVGIAYSAYQALKAWNDDKRIREMKGHIYLNLDNARELTVGLVDAWKNGLSRFANDLETAINEMVDKLGMNSQLDAIVPVDIVQQDAGFVVRFKGAAEQWFKTAEEAFNAALLGTLERATISGISPEQQAVLDHAARNVRSSTPQSVSEDLGLATWVRDLGQSDFGTRFRTEMETFQDAIHRASELGFPTASIQRIVTAYNQFLADSKASLDATVASLSGTGNDWTAMVDERMQRIRDVIAAERDYNRTLDEQALANARRVEEIRAQIARLEAMTNHTPVTIKDFKPTGPGDTPGPSGPGDTGGGTGDGGTGRGRGPLGGGGEYDTDRIREQIEALYRELDALGGVALDTAADINASTLSMIQGTRDLFTSGLKEYLDIGKSQFQLANEKAEATFRGLSGPDGAIQHLYDENMKLAEGMTDARAQTAAVNAAEAIRTQQLAELAEAERKWSEEQKRLAQETAASIFDQIAAMLPEGSDGRQQAIDQSEKLRWSLAKAKLQLEFEGLKIAEHEYELKHDGARLIAQQTLDTIGGLIALIPDAPPLGGAGGGHGGGGNRQAKADFLDELARLGRPESTGPLGDALQGINDQFDGLRKRAQDLHFGQDVIDQINKLEDAAKKALGAKTSADLIADIHDRGPVGDARAALIKKQQDMMAHAAELGMDPALIRRWFHHMMNVLVAEVQGAIASFSDLSGLGDQFHAISDKAADLRKSVAELGNGMTDAERAAALAAIDIAETARLQALAGQTVLGIFQQMADMLPEGAAKEEVIKRAKEAQYQLALAELRLKIEGLKVAELEYEATHDGQRLIAQETFDFFEQTFRAIQDANNNNPAPTPPDPAAIKAWQDAMADFRGPGVSGEFRAISREADDLRNKLKLLTLTEAERARMIADIDAAEQARLRDLADRELLGLFQSIADMLPDGTTEKAAAVAMAKQLEYQMAMAELQLKYQGLIVANEEYKIRHDGLGLLKQETLDWIGDAIDLIQTMHGPQGGAGDGGGGITGGGTTGPAANDNGQGWWEQHAAEQEALAQAAADHAQQLADLYDTLRGYQDLRLSAPERELRDLLSTFDDLRQRCIDLGGDMSQVDDAMGAALGDFWDRLLGPLREFEQSLNLDTSLSTLTPAQRMQEAQRQFDAAAARAQAGDLSAYAQLPELARQLLTEGRGFYASGSEYNALVTQIEALFASLQAGHPTLIPGAGTGGGSPIGIIGPHGPLEIGDGGVRGPIPGELGAASVDRVDSGLAGIATPIVKSIKQASDAQIATRHEEMRIVQQTLAQIEANQRADRDERRAVGGKRG